jgi:hypothetical protein
MRIPRRTLRVITRAVGALTACSGRDHLSPREIGDATRLLAVLVEATALLGEAVEVSFTERAEVALASGRLTAWQRDQVTAAAHVVVRASVAAHDHRLALCSAVEAVRDTGPHLD